MSSIIRTYLVNHLQRKRSEQTLRIDISIRELMKIKPTEKNQPKIEELTKRIESMITNLEKTK